jgi:hypothetical protein
MNRLSLKLVAAVALGLMAGVACEEDGVTGPFPGTVVVTLTTPHADDGALLLTISGGGITGPESLASSNLLFYRALDTSSMNLAIVGNVVSGPLLSFEVPDIGRAAEYTVTLIEVADEENELRESLVGYELTLVRQ